MSSMKKGLCWALTTLQVTPENVSLNDSFTDHGSSIHLPLGSSNINNDSNNGSHNKHHHPHPLNHKNAAASSDSSSSSTTTTTSPGTSSSAVTLLKETVHSVVGALLGSPAPATLSEDLENVQPSYSRQEVSDHCHMDSCWIVVNNRVYDVTRFLRMHPGGEDIILEHGGYDATTAFIEKGHSLDAFDMLGEYCIGEINQDERYPETNHT